MDTLIKIRSPYSYRSRRGGSVVDVVTVDVVDTSVENVKNNISATDMSSSKPFYTNSDVPVSVFGPGITAVQYDPIRHRGAQAARESVAGAAAAAPSSPSAANAVSNAAAAAVPSSNAATVQNS